MSQKINLLYAEDNSLTALLVKRQLERENFTVKNRRGRFNRLGSFQPFDTRHPFT